MPRIRLTVIAGGLAIAMAASSASSYAQQGRGGRGNRNGGQGSQGAQGGQGGGGFRGQGGQGGGGFRGQGGPGGPGGPGGFGGFGGPGNSILNLAGLDPVQKEIKITDAQKPKLTKLTTEMNTKRREFFQNMRQQMDAARSQLQNEQSEIANGLAQNQPLDARDQALTGLQGNGGGFGANPYAGGQNGVDPNALRQGFRQQQNEAQREGMQMMREGMEQLEANAEKSLAKTLDKNQMRRLYEIQLQLEGPFAVLKPDMAERLELREEQADEIQQAQAEAGEARRQIMAQNRDLFRSMRENQGGGADNGASNGQQANGNGNGRGGRGNNSGPGGQGGADGNRRGGFDPEAMRKFMEQPDVKARMEESRKQEEAITERSYALVYKSLDKPQVSTFKKLLGEPFDLNQVRQAMMRGGPGGPGGPRNAANTPASNNSTAGDVASRNERPAAKAATKAADANETTTSTATKSAATKTEAPKSTSGIKSTRGRGGR